MMKKTQAFVLPEERCSVVERELDLAGYFCIITSEKMSAKEAIELYKSRDTSEKLFRGDKTYLGNKSIRVYSEESARAKIFVEFVAMILRCRMYIKLKEEMKNLEKKPNYMTVPAALKELEKIEKAEADVIAAKKKYDQATANLKELLDKRDAIRKDEILSAIVKSGRSYEEIMNFLNVEETKE